MLGKLRRRHFVTIITVFFNMRREAPRTLYSMSREYQRIPADLRYRVVGIDHGSTSAIQPPATLGTGIDLEYRYVRTRSPSPVAAINEAAAEARSEFVMIHIDGARILSPGLIDLARRAASTFDEPFVYTLGWHLGPDIQNRSMAEGYDQSTEDRMLDDIDWRRDGYRLFDVSTLALSSARGFFGAVAESNCFLLRKRLWLELGGFDGGFQSPGGGLVNLDFFDRACRHPGVTPVCLLGEGTFHQVHGGVATNVSLDRHPMEQFRQEYRALRGRDWESLPNFDPVYLGRLHPGARRFANLSQ
jgi:hypothetical protein